MAIFRECKKCEGTGHTVKEADGKIKVSHCQHCKGKGFWYEKEEHEIDNTPFEVPWD